MSGTAGDRSTLSDQQVDEQAPGEEETETVNTKDKARMTPIRDVQYRIDLSQTIAVYDKTPQQHNKVYTPTRYE